MMTADFLKLHAGLCDKLQSIVKAKNHDYSKSSDPFSNFKIVEEIGIGTVEQGILTRICDKISRASNLTKGKSAKVKDESIEDTLLDLANYALILILYLKSKKPELVYDPLQSAPPVRPLTDVSELRDFFE